MTSFLMRLDQAPIPPTKLWMSKKDFITYSSLVLNFSYPVLEVLHYFYNRPTREVKSQVPLGFMRDEQIWYTFLGLPHNEDGPSTIVKINGILASKYYQYQGQYHRNSEGGLPAVYVVVHHQGIGHFLRQEWYVHGRFEKKEVISLDDREKLKGECLEWKEWRRVVPPQ